MAFQSVQRLVSFWQQQKKNWRTVVVRRIFNRFFNRLTLDYTNIYVRELGASPVELGAVNSISGIGSTLLAMPIGFLHDKYSLRKLFIFGSLLTVIASLLYAISSSWLMIIPAIVLTKIISRFHCSVICDLSLQTESRATAKSLCEGAGSIPSLFAPLLAAFLITLVSGQISAEGIRPLYWIQFLAHALLLIFIVVMLKEIARPISPQSTGFRNLFSGLFQVLKQDPSLKRYVLFYSMSMFTLNMITPFWYPFANEIKHADQFIISSMATVSIFVTIVSATPLGRLADKIGRKKVYYLLNPLVASANLLLLLSPSTSYFLILPALLRGFDTVIRIVIIGAMTPELIPSQYVGRWRGILGLFAGITSVVAPIIGGMIWETLGPSFLFILATILEITITLPLITSIKETLTQ
jgi:MFS family permease